MSHTFMSPLDKTIRSITQKRSLGGRLKRRRKRRRRKPLRRSRGY